MSFIDNFLSFNVFLKSIKISEIFCIVILYLALIFKLITFYYELYLIGDIWLGPEAQHNDAEKKTENPVIRGSNYG